MTTIFALRRFTALLVAALPLMLIQPLPAQPSLDFSGLAEQASQDLVDVKAYLSRSSVAPGGSYQAAVVTVIEHGWHINSHNPHEDYLIPARVTFDTLTGIVPQDIFYPPGSDVKLLGETMSVYDGQVIFPFTIQLAQNVEAGDYELPVRLTYQPCNDRECRAPQTVTIPLKVSVGEEGEETYAHYFRQSGQFSQPQPQAGDVASATSIQQDNELQRLIDKYGFWGYLLALGLAFVTGVLLSFSPCTYPMIPITVSIFAGQSRTVSRGFFLSLIYVGSMAIVYGIMGLVVALIGGVFGAWLASPPVVIGIVIVFVIFALSMFGLYELQVPTALRNRLGARAAGSGGVGGVVLLGIIAALVISPCVGPFVAGILLYVATSGSPAVGFLVLFTFALGLGTLYIIIGTSSSAISSLPGAGQWMESVKKFFGFVLLLMALYFLQTLISPELTALLTGILLLVFGVFGGGLDRLTPESGFFLRLKKLLGIAALVVAFYLLGGWLLSQGLIHPPADEWLPSVNFGTAPANPSRIEWVTDLETGMNSARAEQKPVLIDTWATWCINCRILDKKTFGNPQVVDASKRFVPIKVQLEKADSPITKDFMSRFGLRHYSLPTTILIDSAGKVSKVLQGVIGPEEMLAHLNAVR